ncbi:CG2982 [Drosophila busckii]|uniref:Bifunctional lysine-specific demethylase and histidyl-hydroxylase n=1 Tax=Drosophila busckii TaxID=30019 RepID=A0A0M4EUR5_DROBS|nr:CG2982 [Drosophila busckii]
MSDDISAFSAYGSKSRAQQQKKKAAKKPMKNSAPKQKINGVSPKGRLDKGKQEQKKTMFDGDMNNNKNNNKKQPKAQSPQRKSLGSEAPSCPMPTKRGAAPSCPMPSKKSKENAPVTALKGARAAAAVTNKMATKSCPLPAKNKQEKQVANAKAAADAKAAANAKTAPNAKAVANGARPAVHELNSLEEGKRVLRWLLNPVDSAKFFSDYWERNALHIKRAHPTYFSELISFKMIDQMLLRNHLEFTTNIDITSYKDGVRETHNPDGRAMPPAVWGFYGDGCSVRILNPSSYLTQLRQVCSVLQEYFHCLVGANVYLTPPKSQGFAPHYDDIEAFVLQVEGRKRWRLYSPPTPSETLALVSSPNLKPEQLGPPIFDGVLEAGDILYFPRGTVHQALTEKKHHSLHITLSVYQKQAYANLMEHLMPSVLERAVKQHLSLRRGLPLHTWQHLGLAHGTKKTPQRAEMQAQIKRMVTQYLMPTDSQIDNAVDQLAKRYQHEALPPTLLPEELCRTVFGSRSETNSLGQCLCDYEITEQTSVRLLRANILRLMAEDSSLRIYYYVDNALEYCKYEANFMEIEPTEAGAVELLLTTYPKYIKVSQLPLRSAERRVEVVTALWERGLLMTEKPFNKL